MEELAASCVEGGPSSVCLSSSSSSAFFLVSVYVPCGCLFVLSFVYISKCGCVFSFCSCMLMLCLRLRRTFEHSAQVSISINKSSLVLSAEQV